MEDLNFSSSTIKRMDALLKTGVYAIVNKINNKFYVGSAAGKYGFYNRWKNHISVLNGKQTDKDGKVKEHHSIYLQRAWNKYGAENFEFRVLEFVEPEHCIEVEQIYLDASNHSYLYNASKNADNCLGVVRSKETRLKISEFHKGKPKSEEHKQRMRDSYQERDAAKLQAEKIAKTYLFVDPLGEIKEITNLKAFCKTNSLSYNSMRKVFAGKVNNHKGWLSVGCEIKKYTKTGILFSPEGELFEFDNLSKFVKENNLNARDVQNILNSNRLHSNGWTTSIEKHYEYIRCYDLRGLTEYDGAYVVRLPAKATGTKERLRLGRYRDIKLAKFARDLAEVIWDFKYKVVSRK